MAISLIDNLKIQNKKQNVERDSFATIADMVSYSPNYLPNIFHAMCEETGKMYVYNVNNDIDPVLGKWRVLEGSGGGTGTAGKSAYEIAVDNGFVGTETEWLESLKGEHGDKGDNGTTPHIDETTKNWFIGDVDTGILAQGTNGKNGKDGKSISTITKDDNDNIIVTFTDGSTQNIGKLSVDIQGDFLTSDGFGNLRYYNGHFQYYDTATSTWIDTSITPSNVYIMNMTPQPMKSIFGVYDKDLQKYKLKFEEPDDTVIDGQVACIVEKVIIRRKLGSAPADETDGDLVVEVKRNEFGLYKNDFYVDTALSANTDDVYYYKAFPMSTTGFYNTSTLNETDGIKCKNYNLYGFKLDQNESDPASMITYLSDCDNKYYKSAKMNYTTDTFDYGDWADAWFIKNLKPCMLKYDGTVDYELDKNDYTKKADGTASDVANTAYDGNAMVGIPKVYWKIVDNGDNTANVYFCDKKIDNDFHCWSHIDNNGNEIDYCYVPCYNGGSDGTRLRSISGLTMSNSSYISTEINLAKANNIDDLDIWNIELFNDRQLINLLLILIGKNTNTQKTFGNGIYNTSEKILTTGSLNSNGMFYGQNTSSPVKIFGIENYYGAKWRRHLGCVMVGNTYKVKLTYGKQDGTDVEGYNVTGDGYITIENSGMSGSSGGYINKMLFSKDCLIPITVFGSSSTYYCDGAYYDTSGTKVCMFGGYSGSGDIVGAFFYGMHSTTSTYDWAYNSSLSCKPLAPTS